jgi:hypothetical protein
VDKFFNFKVKFFAAITVVWESIVFYYYVQMCYVCVCGGGGGGGRGEVESRGLGKIV